MLDLWISTYLFVYARIVIHKHSVGIAGGLGVQRPFQLTSTASHF